MKKNLFFLFVILLSSIRTFAQLAPIIKVNGSKTGPWSFNFEAGTTACINFTAYASDTSSDDTTIIEWNRGIPSGTFTNINSDSAALFQNDEAVFCWTPTGEYGCKTYYFMVYARYKNKPEIRPSHVVVSFTIWTHPTFTDHIISRGNGTYVFVPEIIDGCGIRYNDTSGAQYFWSIPIQPSNPKTWGSVPTIWYDSVRVLTHTFPKNGTYYYKQWISEPFKGAHNVFRLDSIHVTDALETGAEVEVEEMFGISPNPVKDLLVINGNEMIDYINLFNAQGNEVLVLKSNGMLPPMELIVGEMPPGFYYLHIRTAQGKIFIKKLIITS
ncbi:MAG: T9SS type A sorting domain-containing protein [Bacteroidia bacterium]